MKRIIVLTLVLVSLLGITHTTYAITLAGTLNKSSTQSIFSVNIHGLGLTGAPSLGAFDFDVIYDSSVLTPSTVTFSNFLGISGVDALTSASLIAPGQLNLIGISFLSVPNLDFQQRTLQSQTSPGSLPAPVGNLLQITFDTPDPTLIKTTHFNLAINGLSDAYGNSITATIAVVPEPPVFILLLTGFLWLALIRLYPRILPKTNKMCSLQE